MEEECRVMFLNRVTSRGISKVWFIKLIKELDSVYEINEEVEWFVTFDKKVARTIYQVNKNAVWDNGG